MDQNYTEENSRIIDSWVRGGWRWGQSIDHQSFQKAREGSWQLLLTPTKAVPREWLGDLKGKKILGLASGGGQQIPIFTALGADCTVLDYSQAQLDRESEVAQREGYQVQLVRADMTKPLPFPDKAFDLIFHPVSNCYIQDVLPVWKECHRILKDGGALLSGLDNGFNFLFDEDETQPVRALPFNPLNDPQLYSKSIEKGWGIQFSHTIEEQIGGQLKAGFKLVDIYQDTNGEGRLHEMNVPSFFATRCVK